MIRTVKSLIKRVMHHAPQAQWSSFLPFIMHSINATVARSTGFTPYEAFFGETCRGIVEWDQQDIVPDMENMTAADMSRHVERLKTKLNEARKRIQETEKEYRKQSQI